MFHTILESCTFLKHFDCNIYNHHSILLQIKLIHNFHQITNAITLKTLKPLIYLGLK